MTDCDSTVLVVEDDAELNRLMGAYVSLCGCKYRSALTGSQAVDAATGRAPALVLLDLMLPDIDGFEVCRYLRAAAQTRNVPIVIDRGGRWLWKSAGRERTAQGGCGGLSPGNRIRHAEAVR